ncbi:winged helix DNA-binding domain-containing protein [Leptospira kmetyi]|uniref:Winged helix DNA-binding domain-containing protein n=1 Tax=Leptospira kmetyi TaxID=408139 RepID=A0AAD0USG0_9LEPT|nr:winged helix DNA-binding domain-containing protein [Leptospira kmetyi]
MDLKLSEIAALRLFSHRISKIENKNPAEVVAWLGAIQGQDYFGSKWSIGLRLTNSRDDEIEKAISQKRIVRSWPLRGTLHFTEAKDLRWMLELLGPKLVRNNAKRYQELELDSSVFKKCNRLIIQELKGNKSLTREELTDLFSKAGIDATKNRLSFILQRAGLDQILCFGERREKEFTYVLFDEWLVKTKAETKTDEEALNELAMRFFRSRGPATIFDFIWWSGLSASDAKKALDGVSSRLKSEVVEEKTYWMPKNLRDSALDNSTKDDVYLLPGFDEFLLGYTDRGASIDVAYQKRMIPANGVFSATIVVAGKVIGTWKRTFKKDHVLIEISPFVKPNGKIKDGIVEAAERYSSFLELPPKIVF